MNRFIEKQTSSNNITKLCLETWWISFLKLLFTSCVMLNEPLSYPEPPFPDFQARDIFSPQSYSEGQMKYWFAGFYTAKRGLVVRNTGI
jgi:hypothetical protein